MVLIGGFGAVGFCLWVSDVRCFVFKICSSFGVSVDLVRFRKVIAEDSSSLKR